MRVTSEVDDAEQMLHLSIFVASLAHIRDHVVVRIPRIDPLKAGVVVIPHGRRRAVDMVQIPDKARDPLMLRVIEEPPVEAIRLAPLALLRELLAHEQELFAGV